MDSEQFLAAARDPIEWFDKADELRVSADVLWQCYATETDEYRKMAAFTTSIMVYAMAIEAALKGRLLKQDPDRVRFSLETDGAGRLESASIKQFGVGSHNLEALAEAVSLVAKNDDPDRREVLRRLADCLVWISRYPVPKAVSGDKKVRAGVPIMYKNTSIRVYIDEILNELLANYERE